MMSILQKLAVKQTAKIIGCLCWDVHPECKTHTDAVKLHKEWTDRMIRLKQKNNISYAEDIEFSSVLNSAIEELERR